MNDSGECDGVSLGEEPGRLQTNDDVFSGDAFLARSSNSRVACSTARRCAARCEVVGQTKLDGCTPVFPSNRTRFPESSVFEIFADGWLNWLTFILEVGQLVRLFCARKIDRFFSCETLE